MNEFELHRHLRRVRALPSSVARLAAGAYGFRTFAMLSGVRSNALLGALKRNIMSMIALQEDSWQRKHCVGFVPRR